MLLKLKGCPFCGAKPVLQGKDWIDIVCLNCYMAFSYYGCNSLSSAAEKYNSRVSSSEEFLFLVDEKIDDKLVTIHNT